MKKLRKGERGVSLIELVIVVAITCLVAGTITALTFQVFSLSARFSNRMTAIRQVQQAGFWVSPDVMMAQEVTPGGCANCLLTLYWKGEGGTGDSHNVTYKLLDMPGISGLKGLQRSHSINGEAPTVTSIAEYIDLAGTSCVWDGKVLTFTVTATVGGQSETRVYQIKRRPGS